ncbi:LOW QUALITY PROTEIN: hypothetical protein Cgig2_004419 [Carnegiea gigantea]|uniref:Uncharacterized protein n=1 Tax=Carnegiea gigantea TaxID=171969 RepID=A0A9Q1JXZ7_9CARY|nr:LOW QUALITY PROTEIN: hypothetical protein Cgig2_004419 [Carnegiea gigantea]
MATLLVKGHRLSLPPMVLGYIYHASHPGYSGEAGATLPIHYVIGWLAELFPRLYSRHPDLMPIQCIPTSLASLFCNLKENWVWESTLKEVEMIIGIIADLDSSKDLPASREQVFQSLSALHSMIDIYKLSAIEICWLSSKMEEIFEIAESVTQIQKSVDIDWVNTLSDQDLTCSSEIVHIKGQLDNLSNESSKLRLKEQEILKEEKRISKMQKNLTRSLIEAEGKLKSSLDLKKKKTEQDVEKEKDHLKNLISSVIFFNNV